MQSANFEIRESISEVPICKLNECLYRENMKYVLEIMLCCKDTVYTTHSDDKVGNVAEHFIFSNLR